MIAEIQGWQVYLGLALNGLFTGLGSAIGIYFAQRFFITHADKIGRKNGNKRKSKGK